jgi:hypothetical protein
LPSSLLTSSPSLPALLNVRKSKMDQEGQGQLVAVAHGQHAAADPVASRSPGGCPARPWVRGRTCVASSRKDLGL